ncbi:hypothetical protein GCM10010470_02190 [Saccharopolyspora taberi]|uniref:Uncharacterized protein n=1 Tax=Saccharopolyspora taberi TaxID=60895 RepID=A0ABN3V0W8_9PSEU
MVGDPGDELALIVINPSCEQLLVQKGAFGRWRNATLDMFIDLGFKASTGTFPGMTDTVEAQLDGNRMTVKVVADLPGHTVPVSRSWSLSVEEETRRKIARSSYVAVAMTTKTLPTLLSDLTPAFNDPEAVSIGVPLTR